MVRRLKRSARPGQHPASPRSRTGSWSPPDSPARTQTRRGATNGQGDRHRPRDHQLVVAVMEGGDPRHPQPGGGRFTPGSGGTPSSRRRRATGRSGGVLAGNEDMDGRAASCGGLECASCGPGGRARTASGSYQGGMGPVYPKTYLDMGTPGTYFSDFSARFTTGGAGSPGGGPSNAPWRSSPARWHSGPGRPGCANPVSPSRCHGGSRRCVC